MSNDVDRTLWVGNLSEKVTDEILYELFLQAGPLEKVSIAKERDTGKQKNFAFVTFSHDVSVPYTIKLMDGLQLFGRNLRLQTRPGSIHQQQQQQQQQQHQQPTMNQGSFRNFNNPYQNTQIIISPQPYQNNQFMQMNTMPPNPFAMNQPMRIQHSVGQHPPSFHRSHTWHGNDLSSGQQVDQQDRDERRGQDRDRYSNRDRERSNSRTRRDGNPENNERDEYRHSPSSYNRNGNAENRNKNTESFESRRQKVLQKHDRVIQSYRREKDSRPSPPYHNHKRGRY
ncbi:RNA-binding protein 7-like [Ruditapes philippinarum]|uniref:RNA-binding protein 7-like n=1 Tax=Ruditapes philippinarum TaxID=129788 RepID=UPI00295B0CBA|nr:RNA-binding protein 7-like [Ruditapes philippinarum]